jgi:hypothetical protein
MRNIRGELQAMRDYAETECLAASERGDSDSAEAWEHIGTLVDECQQSMKRTWAIVAARRGLFVEIAD